MARVCHQLKLKPHIDEGMVGGVLLTRAYGQEETACMTAAGNIQERVESRDRVTVSPTLPKRVVVWGGSEAVSPTHVII